jgi:hypothetical protein
MTITPVFALPRKRWLIVSLAMFLKKNQPRFRNGFSRRIAPSLKRVKRRLKSSMTAFLGKQRDTVYPHTAN